MRTRKEAMPDSEVIERWPSLKTLAGPTERASEHAWVAVFSHKPEVMHRVLRELIKQVYAKPGRTGQRPMPREEEVDFWGLLHGEQTDLSIREVLPKVTKLSERQITSKIAMSRSQYQRMMKGEYEPTAFEIREIARIVGKSPTFFVEYRKMMAVSAFINLINDRPGIASNLYRHYLEVRAS
jgi:hypothetical protein